MLSRHSHFGGTRWIHLWLELRQILGSYSHDMGFDTNHNSTMDIHLPKDDVQLFLYHTSHNLKAPISRLKGLINLILLEGEGGHKSSEQYVCKIDQELKQMEKMLAKLQILSDTLGEEQVPEECKPEDIVNEILCRHQQSVKEKNIFVQVHADSELKFRTYRPFLQLIFENLLENAIQYSKTNDKEAKLDICLEKRSRSLLLRLEDNGEGIRETSKEKVFDIFFRDSNKSEGGGLGLYIVKESLKKLKGSVQLESEEGKYTRFFMTIPEVVPLKKGYDKVLSEKDQSV